ncbi:MAG TPA: hypothetical protein PLL69_08785, partial [Gemmatimonadales bacterium]|nr:hypothetical protein [Gemmatimonadales bacterium]
MRSIPLLLLLAAPLTAQTPAVHDSIMLPVRHLFDGMRAHDSTLIASAFVKGAVMMSQVPAPGTPQQVSFTSADR